MADQCKRCGRHKADGLRHFEDVDELCGRGLSHECNLDCTEWELGQVQSKLHRATLLLMSARSLGFMGREYLDKTVAAIDLFLKGD